MNSSERTAVVTGASRGFGRAISLELARQGFRVGLVGRSTKGLEETQRQAEEFEAKTQPFTADISDADSVLGLVDALTAWTNALDLLVNNAGLIEPLGAFADGPFDAWEKGLRTNVEGTARVTHALLPFLLRAPRASIVTISSGAAVSDISGWSAYCTSKAALDRFATVLDAELRDRGVRSYSFAPGTIDTGMQRAIRQTGVGPARLVSGEVEHLPPEVPARAVAFLATPEAEPLAGRHLDIRYPEVREALGLPAE